MADCRLFMKLYATETLSTRLQYFPPSPNVVSSSSDLETRMLVRTRHVIMINTEICIRSALCAYIINLYSRAHMQIIIYNASGNERTSE